MSIGLAGFSAVVGAFTTRGELSPADRTRFLLLFATAFLVAVLAFVPILLNDAGWAGPMLWRASSAAMVTAIAAVAGFGLLYKSHTVLGSTLSGGVLMMIPVLANLSLQMINIWSASSTIYIVGTLFWLYSAGLLFVSIVLERPAV
jgi:hypothetical protein